MATAPAEVPRDRRLALLGWGLAVLALLLIAAVPFLVSGGVNDRPQVVAGYPARDYVAHLVIVASLVLSGAWLVHLRPRNAIGWILLASGALQAVQTSTDAYGIRALTDPDHSLPLARSAEWVAQWTWIPALLLVVAVLPILYPTGYPSSRFWRRHLRVTVVGLVCLVSAAAIASAHFDDSVTGYDAGYTPPTWLVAPLAVIGIITTAGCVLVTLVGTVVRTVRAGAPERQQLALLVAVVALMLVFAFVPGQFLFAFVYASLPVAIVVGVLRYRLLGIEVAVRRTLLYVPLTVLVAVVVGLSTASLARLLPDGPLPLLLGSAVVAVFIFPVARLLQRGVDRFVLGDRADPLRQVAGVAAELAAPSEDPVSSMLAAVTTATGATYGAVCGADGAVLVSLGTDHVPTHQVPLRLGDEDLGTLVVGPRRGSSRVADDDARLIDALAPHLAMVVHASRLTAALAEQQARATRATLTERDRLRRDLHDGLGPSLSGISLSLEAALVAIRRDPGSAAAILERTRAEADDASREVRRVIDALRPTALDRADLARAVRQTATGLGLGRPGGTSFSLEAGDLEGLPPVVEEAAYRIVAESLTNVVRHADASCCVVRLSRGPGVLRLVVEDDGTGVDDASPGGHGLGSMRRRAGDLGGRLVVRQRVPAGTTVDAVLPWVRP
ncbi:sensor histidine kinase [Nocardioides taihuensis]|uniref:histidine kinase n=1 Tax=Nocardioides taihuensis TaxID=1835606 RepID=A0ABW0BF26_9ACTN